MAVALSAALKKATALLAKHAKELAKEKATAGAIKKLKGKKAKKEVDAEKTIEEALSEALEEMALLMETEAVRLCPVNTGLLKQSITSGVEENSNTVWVGAGFIKEVNYAKFVEYGTPPHIIRPKTKKALSWEGAKHPVKMVRHPGTRPRPFLRPAAQKIRAQFPAILARKLSE